MRVVYFASGASAPADMDGFARILHPIGVSIPELSEPATAYLCGLAGLPLPVFVDTGAFSEVTCGPAGIEITHPIGYDGWCRRIAVQRRLSSALRGQAYVVAPDRVGDQEETLRRLEQFAADVRKMRAEGARIVMPIQRGVMSRAAFDRAVGEVLGFHNFIRAIPSNKDAMQLGELEDYLRAMRPTAVHFLGLGPKHHRFPAVLKLLRRLVPTADVSCDSNAITASTGFTNGAGGRMRSLTGYQHPNEAGSCLQVFGRDGEPSESISRSDAIALTFGPALFFQRAIDAGLLVSTKDRPLQLGLFDGVTAALPIDSEIPQ